MALILSSVVFAAIMIAAVCLINVLDAMYNYIRQIKTYVEGTYRRLTIIDEYLQDLLPRRDDKGRFVKNGS